MRAKKVKKPARSIRYLLSADWGQKRISLKRMSERLKKATTPARPGRSSRSRGTKKPGPRPWAISPRAIVLAAVCVMAAAALITARQPSPGADAVSVESATDATASADLVASTQQFAAKEPVELRTRPAAPLTQTSHLMDKALPAEPAKRPVVKSEPTQVFESAATTESPAPTAAPSSPAVASREPVESTTKPETSVAAVTIMGCVRRGKDGFWLKDTAGEDAPKSRNWKFGFLKKRSTSIELVNPPDGLRLADYVGRRVAATGTLVDREMRPRSMRQVAAVCD